MITKKFNSDYIITLSVIGCSLVLLAALTLALSKWSFKPTGNTYAIDISSSAGIRVHSGVRYAGAPIGTVTGIRPLTEDERRQSIDPKNAVRITINVDADMPNLREDSYATITSDTLLAEKFVNLDPGSLDKPVFAQGAILRGLPAGSFDELARSGTAVVGTVEQVLLELKEKHPDLPKKIGDLFEHTDQVVLKIDTLLANNEGSLDQLLKDLSVISKNLKVVSTYGKAAMGTVGQRPWRLIWGGESVKLPDEKEILKSSEPIPIKLGN
jgi:phospholipid/cholesterol/gamma-HCH transport system substrate-binding protein